MVHVLKPLFLYFLHVCHETLVIPEGVRESAINRAEGLKQSTILSSEAVRIEQINRAKGWPIVC